MDILSLVKRLFLAGAPFYKPLVQLFYFFRMYFFPLEQELFFGATMILLEFKSSIAFYINNNQP
jgi:hypothetical protein